MGSSKRHEWGGQGHRGGNRKRKRRRLVEEEKI